jgi:P27 family predicted phage terminase small subunit
LTGNPGKRPLNRREPKPATFGPKDIPAAPGHLSKDAKKIWDDLAPELVRAGLLTVVDVGSFSTLCSIQAQLDKIEKEMGKKDYSVVVYKTTTDRDGNTNKEPKANPLIMVQRQLLNSIRPLQGEFGLTPGGRGKLQLPGPDEDPMKEFLT